MFVIAGDIGAGANIIRNLMLLSQDTHWIASEDRFHRICKQYPEFLKAAKNKWLQLESSLRYCDSHYGIDISHDIDLEKFDSVDWNDFSSHPVLLNHSFVWETDKFNQLQSRAKTLAVIPRSPFGLEWQIRAYTEKKGANDMHNFTFESNIEKQKQDFIATHGLREWCYLNIKNMREIISARAQACRQQLPNEAIIDLEMLIYREHDAVYKKLTNYFDIDIPKKEFDHVLDLWNNLHWPVELTLDWEYQIAI